MDERRLLLGIEALAIQGSDPGALAYVRICASERRRRERAWLVMSVCACVGTSHCWEPQSPRLVPQPGAIRFVVLDEPRGQRVSIVLLRAIFVELPARDVTRTPSGAGRRVHMPVPGSVSLGGVCPQSCGRLGITFRHCIRRGQSDGK